MNVSFDLVHLVSLCMSIARSPIDDVIETEFADIAPADIVPEAASTLNYWKTTQTLECMLNQAFDQQHHVQSLPSETQETTRHNRRNKRQPLI